MRLESFTDDSADGEDRCRGIDAVKTDDAASAGNSEADAFVGTAGELFKKGPRFDLKRAGIQGARA
jgi:hypothetical protein